MRIFRALILVHRYGNSQISEAEKSLSIYFQIKKRVRYGLPRSIIQRLFQRPLLIAVTDHPLCPAVVAAQVLVGDEAGFVRAEKHHCFGHVSRSSYTPSELLICVVSLFMTGLALAYSELHYYR